MMTAMCFGNFDSLITSTQMTEHPRKHKISVTPDGERANFAYRLVVGTGIVMNERVTLD